MKKLLFIFFLGCGGPDDCATPVSDSQIESCKKACTPNGMKKVTSSKCECNEVPK